MRFNKNQRLPSWLMATDDWVRGTYFGDAAANRPAVPAVAVPLRQPSASSRAQQSHAHRLALSCVTGAIAEATFPIRFRNDLGNPAC